jgi:hypothetical protein
VAGSHAWCGKLDLITYFSVAYLQQMMPWVCMDQCQLWHKPTCWPALPLLLLHTAYYDAQSKSYMLPQRRKVQSHCTWGSYWGSYSCYTSESQLIQHKLHAALLSSASWPSYRPWAGPPYARVVHQMPCACDGPGSDVHARKYGY